MRSVNPTSPRAARAVEAGPAVDAGVGHENQAATDAPTTAGGQPAREPGPLTRGVDGLLALLTVALAALLASFAAHNSDLWLHLATGRALVSGEYAFGTHPFTYTGGDAYWANNSWLSDALFYLLYTQLGGWSLVALKTLVVAATTCLMIALGLRSDRRQRSLLAAVACALVGVLCMAPWLLLRSLVVSYLFLALTLLFLERGTRAYHRLPEPPAPPAWRDLLATLLHCYWPLLVLFALWVNLDGWFLVGLLTVALYAVGQSLAAAPRGQGTATDGATPAAGAASMRLTLGILTGLAVAACLLNPHLFRAFRFPALPGFSLSTALMEEDPYWRSIGLRPLDSVYLWPAGQLNAGAVAYFVLLALGFVSFTLPMGRLPWWRLLLWGAFALLSLYQAHLVPFFAVVAAPLTALNLQHVRWGSADAPEQTDRVNRFAAGVVRLAAILAAPVLLVLAWPGWLQPEQREPRAWDVTPDPSLQAAALELARWRAEHVTGSFQGFNSSLELANVGAWYCPGEKWYLNGTLHGGRAVVADYLTLRRELITGLADPKSRRAHPREEPEAARWPKLFAKHQIGYIVLDAGHRQQADTAFMQFVRTQNVWSLAYLQGSVAVFAWRDATSPAAGSPLAKMRLDPNAEAFRPAADRQAPPNDPAAYPPAPAWWQPFVRGAPAPALKRDLAGMYLNYYPAAAEAAERDSRRFWNAAQVAGLAGDWATLPLQPVPCFPQGDILRLATASYSLTPADRPSSLPPVWWQVQLNAYMAGRDLQSPGSLLLAARTARQAIAEDAEDGPAYQFLGNAYYGLLFVTREDGWTVDDTWFRQMRIYQMLAAYQEAVRLNPDLDVAHLRLVSLYDRDKLDLPDLKLRHMQEYLRCQRKVIPPPALRARFEQEMGIASQQIEELEKQLQSNAEELRQSAGDRSPLAQAEKAAELGLVKTSLEILLNAAPDRLGEKGTLAKLRLSLKLGRAREVEGWLQAEPAQWEERIGYRQYHVLRAQVAAALGNYRQADEHLRRLLYANVDQPETTELRHEANVVATALADVGSVGATQRGPVFLLALTRPPGLRLQENAEITALRGVLALEQGDVAGAEQRFRESLLIWQDERLAQDFPGRRLAEGYLKLIEANKGP